MPGIPTLTGQHVRLEKLSPDHASGLWEASRFDEIWSYMPKRPRTLDEMCAMIESFTTPTYLDSNKPYAIIEAASNAVIGSTQLLDIDWANRGAEIGWTWLTPRVWRSPVNTECKLLLLAHCFETLKFLRVQLKTDARNERSQKAIERLGAVREGVLRRHRILSDGFVRDSVYYSIVSEEWPAVRDRLNFALRR
ncbi:MAG: GNAT family protein [Capsulimonadaceae bacterium]|nr:GNAT family protein [Capsulimonadaceae bacterium]